VSLPLAEALNLRDRAGQRQVPGQLQDVLAIAETTQAEIVNKTPNLVKVCSASHIEHLVRQAGC
jgi:hypothetical protein